MKKAIGLLFLLMSIPTVNAQMVKFGLKAGANFSNLEGDNVEGSTYTSFHFGAVLELKLLENLSVQPELLYSSQGTKVNSAAFDDINYNYITVPVLAKFYLTGKKLSLEAGPQFSFLVNENVEDQFEGETFDFGLAAGLGYNITDHVFVQARYVAGLTEASKNAEVTNRVMQVSLGYRF
ncbi:porin family protein [Flavobacterium sedimenticola]|uniref:Porin family protein n=1 Tax=Flavobacterium sedimenticola TaxID=3043286 RepID=A0ABT6XQY2_9FLAO|nr:porin family protein [Flavobacterium sedimenticola]MDI9257433.1 porin family protein [Flavobacterium sedimenticola]